MFSGLTPSFLAKYVFATAPNICCGDLAVERLSTMSGYWDFKKRTHPGQQEVNMGHLCSSLWARRSRNSVPSSMIVRSAEKLVSNI